LDNTTIGNCLERLKLVKTVLLKKQRIRTLIGSGYKVTRILEKDFTLTLVPLNVKALEDPSFVL
jgi:hypothetical protein